MTDKHTPKPPEVDAEFLSKRLGRVCSKLGISQPFGDNHEANAEVAGTTLGNVAREIDQLTKQLDDLLAVLKRSSKLDELYKNQFCSPDNFRLTIESVASESRAAIAAVKDKP